MDLKELESVVALAEQGSFVRAAEKLFVTQPALSRKISALERELEVRLFERNSHGLTMTRAGQRFYNDAKMLLSLRDILEKDMKEERQKLNTLLLVYTGNGHVPYAAEMIRKARQECPGVTLIARSHYEMTREIGRPLQIQELLKLHYCELVFLAEPEYTEEVRQVADSALLEPGGLCAFVRHDHPWAKRKSLIAGEVREASLLLPPATFAPELTRRMEEALGRPGKLQYSTSPTNFRMQVISENLTGVMPWASRNIQDEYLSCVPIGDIPEGFGLLMVWRREEQRDALSRFLSAMHLPYQK